MKTDFFKQILQSTIFLFLFLNKVSSYSTTVIHVIDENYTTKIYLGIKIKKSYLVVFVRGSSKKIRGLAQKTALFF